MSIRHIFLFKLFLPKWLKDGNNTVSETKKGTSYILGILAALLIFSVVLWLVLDQNDRTEAFSSNQDTTENDDYRSYGDNRDDLSNSAIKAYVSFVNRQVIPADTIDNRMTEEAVSHLNLALSEVTENPSSNRVESDTVKGSGDRQNQYSVNHSLIDAGNELVAIQKNEYPAVSRWAIG